LPWGAAAFLAALALPTLAQAAPIEQVVAGTGGAQSANLYNMWEFSRSLVNWGLVAVLVATALANIFHFNIDTYGVKKVLPNLLIAFFLANFSLFICRTILEVAESLLNTADTISQQATGEPLLTAMFSSNWAMIGAVLLSLILGFIVFPPISIFIGIAIALIILFFPIIAMAILWFLAVIRHYVLLYLVALSPLAFLAMGIPFTQKWFQKWWSLFMTWAFLKAVGYFFLLIGAIALHAKIGNDFIAMIVATAAMWGAITVPFSMGGALMASVKGVAGMIGGGALMGAGALRHANPERWRPLQNRAGASIGAGLRSIGNVANAARQAPTVVRGILNEGQQRDAVAGQTQVNRWMGRETQAATLESKTIHDAMKDFEHMEADELAAALNETTDPLRRAAIMLQASAKNMKEKMYKAYNAIQTDPNRRFSLDDMAALKRQEVALLGGTLAENQTLKVRDEHGNVRELTDQTVISGALATRIGGQLDALERKNGNAHFGFGQTTVVDTEGRAHRVANDNAAIASAGANMYTGDPTQVIRSLTEKSAMVTEYIEEVDDQGIQRRRAAKRSSDALETAITNGQLNEDSIRGSQRINQDFAQAFRSNFARNSERLRELTRRAQARINEAGITDEERARRQRDAARIERTVNGFIARLNPDSTNGYRDALAAIGEPVNNQRRRRGQGGNPPPPVNNPEDYIT
jgi:hypothetical protein